MAKRTPRRRTVGRGLRLWGTFKDTHGNRIRVQESSAADGPCMWIFCDSDQLPDPSPHLNRAGARRLRAALDRYLADTDPHAEARDGD
jgi:hypothetical protein